MFLLNEWEAKKYFTSDEERKAGITDYAGTKTNKKNAAGIVPWWLRDLVLGATSYNSASYVTGNGSIDSKKGMMVIGKMPIRPACMIDLKKL